jgi:membrane-associated phospholipid phosphatase
LAAGALVPPAGLRAQSGEPSGTLADASTDSVDVGRRPALIQSADWWLGAMFFGSLGATQLDDFDDWISADLDNYDRFARRLPRAVGGLDVSLALTGGTFLLGKAVGSSTVSRVGLRSLESVLAADFLGELFKVGLGRARPAVGLDSEHFEPLTFDSEFHSFPSNHTSHMFALATTLSLELGEEAPWVPFVAYPFAAWTGVSRILDDRHWLTDVIAGAAVGIFSARLVDRIHGGASRRAAGGTSGQAGGIAVQLIPMEGGLGAGVSLSLP